MTQATYLNNHLLIAMPSLQDPNFNQTVIYVCEHSSKGAIGIVINRPTDLSLDYIFGQMDIKVAYEPANHIPVMQGGPIQTERGFILHNPTKAYRSSLKTYPKEQEGLAVTTSQDILEELAMGKGPKEILVALGYAGWEAGQLEEEMIQNVWLSCTTAPDIIFNTPFDKRWEAAAALIGIHNMHLVSGDTGHA
ncbi:MAG: YqgE/AlgH family protein [Legionellales bacterium]|nr:YqgE/AlgH family protein [Legionellales bacterium]